MARYRCGIVTNTITNMVKTYKCPVISYVPSLLTGNKRKRGQQNSLLNSNEESNADDKFKLEKYRAEVRALSDSKLKGLAGIKVKDDVLTNLGVAPPKQQTMPFKMRMGINKGRSIRTEKFIIKAKESGTVVASSLLSQQKKKKWEEPDELGMNGFDSHVKGGVLRITKKGYPNIHNR